MRSSAGWVPDFLIVGVLGLLGIAAASTLSERTFAVLVRGGHARHGLIVRSRVGRPAVNTVIVIRGHTQRVESSKRAARFRIRVHLKIADIDHFLAEPLGHREGSVIVWAGMRGAVTLIAVAFLVAAASLLLQGGTLALLVRTLRPARSEHHEAESKDLQDRDLGPGQP